MSFQRGTKICIDIGIYNISYRTGVLSDDRMKLDYVLGLKIEDFLERRLQTQVILCLHCSNQMC